MCISHHQKRGLFMKQSRHESSAFPDAIPTPISTSQARGHFFFGMEPYERSGKPFCTICSPAFELSVVATVDSSISRIIVSAGRTDIFQTWPVADEVRSRLVKGWVMGSPYGEGQFFWLCQVTLTSNLKRCFHLILWLVERFKLSPVILSIQNRPPLLPVLEVAIVSFKISPVCKAIGGAAAQNIPKEPLLLVLLPL